jgi:hypothetical protein
MPISIEELLDKVDRGVEAKVRGTRDRARNVLREAMRSETRLTMRSNDEGDEKTHSAQVPIEVSPGCPEGILHLSFPDDLLPILELAGYRNSFASVATGITELIEANKMLLRLTGGPKWALQPDDQLRQVRNWSEDILRMLKEHDPVRQILMVNQDVLGSYSYAPRNTDPKVANQASIQLYWTVIGLVAKDLGCEVEDLTVVVMVHELAHAYTQLGADIGGLRWPSSEFAKAEHEIKEGLAQYFTARVLRRVGDRFTGAQSAYSLLLEKQPPAYRTHEDWYLHVSPEAVRRAMLEIRRQGEGQLTQFEARLHRAADDFRFEPV